MRQLFAESDLKDIIEKVVQGQRLTREDGIRLMEAKDLLAVGYMADLVRRKKSGDYAFFIVNRHMSIEDIDCVARTEKFAAMSYGQWETAGEGIDQLIKLRELQDRTGGVLAFMPLAFHLQNTGPEDLVLSRTTTGYEDLRVLAVARLMLDNIDHIKAHWLIFGPKLAQVSLAFGVDDIDGTVVEEQINRPAGADTGQVMTKRALVDMIKAAGRKPAIRDTLYRIIEEVF